MTQRPGPFEAVAEHTYVAAVPFSHEGRVETVTAGLVVGTRAALLVDAGATPEQGRQLAEAAAAVTSVPLTTVVLTHGHDDHVDGAAGVGAETVIAHESVTPAGVALRAVAVATAVDLGGGVRVEAVHLGRGHTEGDLVVVVPVDDVVFAGDLVESAGPPQYGPDTFAHEWPATLDGLIGLLTDQTVVVPGHGRRLDRATVFEQRGRIAAVSGEITRLAGLGVGVEEAERRGDWALPFAAIRDGYAAGARQTGTPRSGRSLPLV